jgi:hypothetical protein
MLHQDLLEVPASAGNTRERNAANAIPVITVVPRDDMHAFWLADLDKVLPRELDRALVGL